MTKNEEDMTISVGSPRFEHLAYALGIGVAQPRISWQIVAPASWRQEAYELSFARAGGAWQSVAPVVSEQQILVPWPTAPLSSREQVAVRVRVHGRDGLDSPWSAPATVEAGLLHPQDWQAVAVGAVWNEDPASDQRRPPLLRRDFTAAGPVRRARLYATAHGLYEAQINGQRVGDDAMSPGWTAYAQRLRYYTYDVTDYIRPGPNAIGAWLGDGWYRGRMGWRGGFRNLGGTDLSFLAQLELEYADGNTELIATDGNWRAAPSPIMHSGNYDGECYDAREEKLGWSEPGFDASSWGAVVAARRDPATLVAPEGPPVRCTQEVEPVEMLTSPSGKTILDFGQNLVGRLRIRPAASAGQRITIRTAEVLQDGELYQRPLRDAKSTDEYISAGRPWEEWEPRFTFHGFRYAEITGWPGSMHESLLNGDVVARVYHSDLERTGWFTCSDRLVNQLHQNVVWSMRGNFLDIPTDCPQRDERVGWTGDLQVFAPTAAFLYDVSGMLSSWLKDVAAEQLPDGTVPWYVPVIPARDKWTPLRPGAAWGDVAVLTPLLLYQRFADVDFLHTQYESARAWVELVARIAGPSRLWDSGFQLGDWLDPDAPPQDPADAKTDKYLVATAYFARSAWCMARIAEKTGHEEHARRYDSLAAQVRLAFQQAYVQPDGYMTSDAQTAYALAICGSLLDGPANVAAGDRLAELVRAAGYRISTGFVGTPLVCDALTMTGHLEEAYGLVMQQQPPSWLYAVVNGATTVWERWDSLRPDGRVNPGSMTSFNHYALGAVADWLHRVVAGLAAEEPGYRRIRFAPRPGGGLTHASAQHETPYGLASIEWQFTSGRLDVLVTLPTGTSGVVALPGQPEQEVGSGQHRFSSAV